MVTRAVTVARWVVGLLLLWAGAAKLAEPRLFFLTLLEYQLPASDGFLRFVAVTLPWLEGLCGALLCANLWATSVRLLVVALCAGFVLATGQAWGRGLDIACGCLGARENGLWATPAVAFARAVVLLAIALWLVLRPGLPADGHVAPDS